LEIFTVFFVCEYGTDVVSVGIGELVELLVNDNLAIHWWGNTDQNWRGKLYPLKRKGKPWIDEMNEDSLFPQILRFTDGGLVRASQAKVIYVHLSRLQESENARKAE
jgi:hypothetical protein